MTPAESIRALEGAVHYGPHLYSATPVTRTQTDLGATEGCPTGQLPGFTTTSRERLRGRQEHGCALQRLDGPHERMSDGAWLGKRIEHLALESQILASARTGGRPRFRIVLACRAR
jgi:hypothetical protein